ncbi:MAG: WD40 repeat domain-containing protein [Planctomycetaceae bacterium]|jgi:WD40 repeat protein|nr:WD40 repeat domain-containing protein [Planctomycetaceae bacterium]
MQKEINQNGIFVTKNTPAKNLTKITTHNKSILQTFLYELCFCCVLVLLVILSFCKNIYADQPASPFGQDKVENLPVKSQLLTASNVAAATATTTSASTNPITEAAAIVKLYEHTQNKNRIPVISCLDIDRTGKLLAVGGDDHKVRFWDVEKRTFVMQVHEHLDWVRDLAFNFDRSKLVTIAHDGQIQFWNVQNGSLIISVKEKVYGLQSVAFSPDGNKIAVCGFDKFVRIYDAQNGNIIAKIETNETGNRTVLFSNDGSQLAVAGRSGIVRIWTTSDTTIYTDIKGSRRRINAIAFSPDGSKLAVGGDSPFISIVNPKTGKRIKRLPERPGKTFSLVFCNDNVIASGESDNAIRIWDITQAKQLTTLIGHTGTVAAMVFDTEKKLLISGGFDTSIRFWNLPEENKNQNNITNNTANLPDKTLQLYPLPDGNTQNIKTPKMAAKE